MELNDDLQVQISKNYLKNKKIGFIVTGGIAAIESPKLARALRRYGADVQGYMTPTAEKFIGKEALAWGTGKEVIMNLSGSAEHINSYDLLLTAPATLNFIGEVSNGMATSPATTLIASALGTDTPILVVPTMHESMYNNPIFRENLEKLKGKGVNIIEPRFSEGKAKIPKLETIVAKVSRELSDSKIKGKRILITGGPTPVEIDSVRRITNRFTGSLAVKIAKEAHFMGADVTLLLGNSGVNVPSYLHTIRHSTYDEYVNNVIGSLEERRYDAGIFSAAVADYRPVEKVQGKIPSGGVLQTIELTPTQKVIGLVREQFPDLYMTTFKLEVGITEDELLNIARGRSRKYNLVVANTWREAGDSHRAYIVESENVIAKPQTGDEIASNLVEIIGDRIR